ncbi:MAG TPA: DinB family protein, partial [Longimicrobiaceae bacterium]|nr:DinB family protein [Longimicrobiaceae bacterium]
MRRFTAAAEGLDEAAWTRPRAPGQWSPAQVAEHLALSYEALLRELGGGPGLRPRVAGLRQRLLRWVLLPHVLFHRTLPVRVRAPRELRPADTPPDRAAVLSRMRAAAERLERGLDAGRATGARVTHPYFGPLPAVPA